jgi:hypothetical protein
LLSIGLVSLLAACGGGGGSSSGGGNNPPPVDTTPDMITFAAQNAVTPSAAVSANEVTVTGINASVPVSITGGEYSIAGGAYTSAAGTVANNQVIRVRVTASTQFSTVTSAVLTVGSVSATFTTTTVAEDTTPDAISFTAQTGVARSTVLTSNDFTVTGINSNASVSITGGEYSIGTGAFTSAAGTVSNNQVIRVRMTSSAQFSTTANAVLTVGGLSPVGMAAVLLGIVACLAVGFFMREKATEPARTLASQAK